MFCVYKELHPPTGIEHSLYCHILSSNEKHLVTAATNYVHVYRLNDDSEVSGAKQSTTGTEKSSRKCKLECMASFQLHGNVIGMQNVRLPGSQTDALVLTYNDAKLSVVEYDPEVHSLKTLSLHYFEEDDYKDGRQQQSVNLPSLCVDPENRCAAMLIYSSRLVILPFGRTTTEYVDPDLQGQNEAKNTIQSSYVINLNEMNEGIRNIKDIQFLHGYYEPTLLILFEPVPTWAGRVALRRDTCSIVALSLNIQEKVHPVIWAQSNLPFDCFQVLPVPKPLGGILVLAVNSMIYLNQSLPPYGVSFNQVTDYSTEYPLRRQEGTKFTLDSSFASFISYDKLVISLKGGELYIVTLMVDNMRALRSFHIEKAAASVLPTSLTVCGNSYLFLGSRLGNSLLLRYTEKEQQEMGKDAVHEPPSKRLRLDDSISGLDEAEEGAGGQAGEDPPAEQQEAGGTGRSEDITSWMASDVSTMRDMDELEVYGTEEKDEGMSHVSQFVFEVCDSLINIGPCGQAVMGEPAFLSDEYQPNVPYDLELVTTSGYGKNGALSVLQRTIRPQVISTFELPGCYDMWTVYGPTSEEQETEQEDKEDEKKENPGHAFLILSRGDSTMVLKTGKEITELDQSGFSTQEPTVFCSNIGGQEYVVQVCCTSIRLLKGSMLVQQMDFSTHDALVHCSLVDSYLLVGTPSGALYLLQLENEGDAEPKLSKQKVSLTGESPLQSLCIYRDTSGLFSKSAAASSSSESLINDPKKSNGLATESSSASAMIDEDELLYGDSDLYSSSTTLPGVTSSSAATVAAGPSDATIAGDESATYWAVFALDDGSLEIYSIPDMDLCYSASDACSGPQVIKDDLPQTPEPASRLDSSMSLSDFPVIRELLMIGLGHKQKRPHLMLRAGEELFIYEAFPYTGPSTRANRLQLRFKKLQHNLILHQKREGPVPRSKKDQMDLEVQERQNERIRWLRPFDNVSGYAGVFICGPYPYWMFYTSRGVPRYHPQPIDGVITSFAPFDNVNCSRGFLYFNKKGELRICALPTYLTYDSPWPVRKVPLRCTPHYVVYHVESKTYSVVTSSTELNTKVVYMVGDGDKDTKEMLRDENIFVWPTVSKYTIQLFSPVSWEPIPGPKFELEPFEMVTCTKHVNLRCEGTVTGMRGYIAVGINFNYHEDIVSRGRIIIYDVIEVVPEPGQPLTKNKIKAVYDKEQKGPVTALDCVLGYLVTAIGQKIYIWQLKDDDLQGVAFIDTQIYIHQISVVKNLILVADVYKSISLLRYQEQFKVLSLVTRDIRPREVYACNFIIHNSMLSFLVSDRLQNLLIMAYSPELQESRNGHCMVRKADFHLGHHVNNFFRARSMTELLPEIGGKVGTVERKHVTFFTTLSGSIGCLVPVMEKNFRRLSMLEKGLTYHIPHLCGLNPRAYRLLKEDSRCLQKNYRNILDGELLWRYLNLSLTERQDFFKRMGLSTQQVRDDLRDIDRAIAHF